MTFIRFAQCSIGCQWCDTECNPDKFCRVYKSDALNPAYSLRNPVGIVQIEDVLRDFSDEVVSITGGEPLEQADFLAEFLPTLQKKRIFLETNGICFEALKKVARYIDIISMDIKLPSSTGTRPYWREHAAFLDAALASGREIYIKIVVTAATTDKDINKVIKMVSAANRHIPVVLQPVTPTEKFHESISDERMLSLKRLFGLWIPNVSVTPQMHKLWEVR
jgi:organic radical activating enzyme